ncbi:unnamed protein product [Amoebophrya sp. A25]|nr:unnamed protein product [Amoebophrya sp. A25]|eukprot:GSA25T00010180001.1
MRSLTSSESPSLEDEKVLTHWFFPTPTLRHVFLFLKPTQAWGAKYNHCRGRRIDGTPDIIIFMRVDHDFNFSASRKMSTTLTDEQMLQIHT